MRSYGWALIKYDSVLVRRGNQDSKKEDCVKTERRRPSTNQEETPYKKPALLTPSSQIFTLKSVRNKFLFFRPPSLWYFLQQPQKTNTVTSSVFLGSLFYRKQEREVLK